MEKVTTTFAPQTYSAADAWIQTYTGVAFPILNPTPDFIEIADIAHALSNLCRFAGHTRSFYSVAQHSILVSKIVPPEFALEGLMHDAPEAYVVDLPRPLKHSGMVDGYHEIEGRVWAAIAKKFDLSYVLPKCVKEADTIMLLTEQRDLMGRQAKPWADKATPLECHILPCPPEAAKERFMARFTKLVRERKQLAQAQSKAA